METLVSLYQHLIVSPDQLTSVIDYSGATTALLGLCILLAWPVALVLKTILNREKLGTTNRIRLALIWTALALAIAFLVDVLVLLVLKRVPDWTAVSPHATLIIILGVIGLSLYFTLRGDLGLSRSHVHNAKQQLV